MEDHVEQQKDNEKHDRNDNLQALLRAQLEFVFAGPLEGIARRQCELLPQELTRFIDEPAVIAGVEVEIYVPGERGILIPDHRRSFGEGDLSEFTQGHLSV